VKRRSDALWRALIGAEVPAQLTPAVFGGGAAGRRARRDTPMWSRARGSHVWDVDGRRYLDLVAGFGVASVGHANPRVVAAVRRQAARLLHGFGDVHPHEARARLAARLARLAPWPDARVLWAQSGSEAVELAWKTAHLATGRPGVLAFEGGYHGDSGLALSHTGWPALRTPFAPLLPARTVWGPYPDCKRCPLSLRFPSCEIACAKEAFARADRRGARVGAVLVEPIQGRGGQVVPPPGFLALLRRETKRRGWLLIADEIYTGLGRTGRRFAFQHEGVVPDLVCVGKTLGGGMPIAAVLGPAKVLSAWRRAGAGPEAPVASTFLAHPVACAAALAALDEIEKRKLAARASRMGRIVLRDLRAIARGRPRVFDVRGRGLLVGIELAHPDGTPDPALASAVVRAALARSLILLGGGAHGNVVSLSPALTLSASEWRQARSGIEAALDDALGRLSTRGSTGSRNVRVDSQQTRNHRRKK
jgi:4-aminobutyrate aminotransferase-like enzyme